MDTVYSSVRSVPETIGRMNWIWPSLLCCYGLKLCNGCNTACKHDVLIDDRCSAFILWLLKQIHCTEGPECDDSRCGMQHADENSSSDSSELDFLSRPWRFQWEMSCCHLPLRSLVEGPARQSALRGWWSEQSLSARRSECGGDRLSRPGRCLPHLQRERNRQVLHCSDTSCC